MYGGGTIVTNEDVYKSYAGPIQRFFINKVAASSKVDDLLHTTFLRFFEKRLVQEIHEPLNYLYVIARNVLYEYWRQQKRSDLHDDVGEHSIASLGAGISTLLTNDERQRLILDSLRELRLDYQAVIEMQYWERLSYKEIAALLDEQPGTIGTWLRRGRAQLRRIVDGKLHGETEPVAPTGRKSDVEPDTPPAARRGPSHSIPLRTRGWS